MEHPWFQRLRRIQQLGLSSYVYPGAVHSRFHHALGAMHLMQRAMVELRAKKQKISKDEAKALSIAILLHDIGHGPFSHALENTLVTAIEHEAISLELMKRLNVEFEGKLQLAIDIFENNCPRHFLHQLVSSQLDADRLDYLTRDSFFSGVQEGIIGYDRIIKMMNVVDDRLVIEEKGIYSIEKFIISRRLMYWQVYLHKTVLSAEMILVNLLKRAKFLTLQGEQLFAAPALRYFLNYPSENFTLNDEFVHYYTLLDDTDLLSAIKVWQQHSDKVLAVLSEAIVQRKLFQLHFYKEAPEQDYMVQQRLRAMKEYGISEADAAYFVFSGNVTNNAYSLQNDKILIAFKNGKVVDIAEASDYLNIQALAAPVVKHYVCQPKGL
ncbi:MAG: HD domain-containing protein [Bacteroidetes bacterium]|nr:HD domain-containing protein [Bacteroidota bacterium]MCB9043619.1 HD domain-containing protein [Chitinophagales bacterium]